MWETTFTRLTHAGFGKSINEDNMRPSMLDGYHHIVISTDTSSCYHREMSTNTHALNTADAMLSTDTQSSCYHHLVISTMPLVQIADYG